jgi:hypothetical protein
LHHGMLRFLNLKKKTIKFFCPLYKVWFRKRNKFCVVRYSGFAVGTEDYYCSMILLLLPHRDEASLMNGCNSFQEAFETKKVSLTTVSIIFLFP